MLNAADPALKRKKKEEEKIRRREELERKQEYLRMRDSRNYEIQKQRLYMDQQRFRNQVRDRNFQRYKDEYELENLEEELSETPKPVLDYKQRKEKYRDYKKQCFKQRYS